MSIVDTPQGRAPRGRAARDILAAEQLQELRAIRQVMTEQAARVAGRMVNNTLLAATYLFAAPPEGGAAYVTVDCRVAAGAIRVTNASAANTVTVAAGPNQGFAPTNGVGVGLVLPLSRDTLPVASRQITLYGTAGDKVSIQVYTSAVEPST